MSSSSLSTPLPVPDGGHTQLTKHFSNRQADEHGAAWSDLWDTDNSDLWDRGKPSPALIDIIEQRRHDLFHPLRPDGRRKRALVPGCGKGYDVAMLALHGFDAYGLEISAAGVAAAERYAAMEMKRPQDYNFGDADGDGSKGLVPDGTVSFIEGDFFNRDWESSKGDLAADVDVDVDGRFDVIYDYTFLCALHPSKRPQWAARMQDLLRPDDGLLVCLEFPMYKDASLPGPPWGLNGVHWDLLARGGNGLTDVETESKTKSESEISSTEQLGGRFRRVFYEKPARSYENGKGTDMLSIYMRK